MAGSESTEGDPSAEHERHIESLRERMEAKVEDAEKLGVICGVMVEQSGFSAPDNRVVWAHRADWPIHPASTFKLAVAEYARAQFRDWSDEQLVDPEGLRWDRWPDEALIRYGDGVYDRSDSPQRASVVEVLYDMLSGRSGNMAQKALIGYTAQDVARFNYFCQTASGFMTPALRHDGEYGFKIHERSTRELLRTMQRMPKINPEAGVLDNAIADALRNVTTKKGTVSGALAAPRASDEPMHPSDDEPPYLQSKTGALNPDGDIVSYLRHDVGRFVGRQGELTYSITTHSDARSQLFIAKRLVASLGAEMGEVFGYERKGEGKIERGLVRAASWLGRLG